MRHAALLASLVLLSACNTIAYDPVRFDPVNLRGQQFGREALLEERAREIAGDLNVTVQSIYVQQAGSVNRRNNDDEARLGPGYIAWMDIAECERGNLAVNFDVFAVPTDAHTRFGCSVEGVPSY